MDKVLLILLAHFVADFIFQTDKQALNKCKSNWWLTSHVAAYTSIIMFFGIFIFGLIPVIILWAFVNGVLHWITDYFTSRANAYFWKAEKRHWFFVGIGADQLIHYTCLLLTYEYFN